MEENQQDQQLTLDQAYDRIAAAYGVPTTVWQSLVKQESGGNINAVGPQTKYGKARGAFQIIPDTFRRLGYDPAKDYSDPIKVAEAGIRYLRDNYTRFRGNARDEQHAWQMAIAAYHSGEDAVAKNLAKGGSGIPNTVDKAAGITTPDYTKSIFSRIDPNRLDRTPTGGPYTSAIGGTPSAGTVNIEIGQPNTELYSLPQGQTTATPSVPQQKAPVTAIAPKPAAPRPVDNVSWEDLPPVPTYNPPGEVTPNAPQRVPYIQYNPPAINIDFGAQAPPAAAAGTGAGAETGATGANQIKDGRGNVYELSTNQTGLPKGTKRYILVEGPDRRSVPDVDINDTNNYILRGKRFDYEPSKQLEARSAEYNRTAIEQKLANWNDITISSRGRDIDLTNPAGLQEYSGWASFAPWLKNLPQQRGQRFKLDWAETAALALSSRGIPTRPDQVRQQTNKELKFVNGNVTIDRDTAAKFLGREQAGRRQNVGRVAQILQSGSPATPKYISDAIGANLNESELADPILQKAAIEGEPKAIGKLAEANLNIDQYGPQLNALASTLRSQNKPDLANAAEQLIRNIENGVVDRAGLEGSIKVLDETAKVPQYIDEARALADDNRRSPKFKNIQPADYQRLPLAAREQALELIAQYRAGLIDEATTRKALGEIVRINAPAFETEAARLEAGQALYSKYYTGPRAIYEAETENYKNDLVKRVQENLRRRTAGRLTPKEEQAIRDKAQAEGTSILRNPFTAALLGAEATYRDFVLGHITDFIPESWSAAWRRSAAANRTFAEAYGQRGDISGAGQATVFVGQVAADLPRFLVMSAAATATGVPPVLNLPIVMAWDAMAQANGRGEDADSIIKEGLVGGASGAILSAAPRLGQFLGSKIFQRATLNADGLEKLLKLIDRNPAARRAAMQAVAAYEAANAPTLRLVGGAERGTRRGIGAIGSKFVGETGPMTTAELERRLMALVSDEDLVKILRNPKATPEMREYAIWGKTLGEGVTIGTVGLGSYSVARMSGASPEEAENMALYNVVFDLLFRHGMPLGGKAAEWLDKRIKDVAGKVWGVVRNGVRKNVVVDPDGNVRRAPDDLPTNLLAGEVTVVEPPQPPRQLGPAPNARRENVPPEVKAEARNNPNVNAVAQALQNGQPQSVADLKKATKLSGKQLDDAIATMYQAGLVEITPDNQVKLVEGEEAADLYNRFRNMGEEPPATGVQPTPPPAPPTEGGGGAATPVAPTPEPGWRINEKARTELQQNPGLVNDEQVQRISMVLYGNKGVTPQGLARAAQVPFKEIPRHLENLWAAGLVEFGPGGRVRWATGQDPLHQIGQERRPPIEPPTEPPTGGPPDEGKAPPAGGASPIALPPSGIAPSGGAESITGPKTLAPEFPLPLTGDTGNPQAPKYFIETKIDPEDGSITVSYRMDEPGKPGITKSVGMLGPNLTPQEVMDTLPLQDTGKELLQKTIDEYPNARVGIKEIRSAADGSGGSITVDIFNEKGNTARNIELPLAPHTPFDPASPQLSGTVKATGKPAVKPKAKLKPTEEVGTPVTPIATPTAPPTETVPTGDKLPQNYLMPAQGAFERAYTFGSELPQQQRVQVTGALTDLATAPDRATANRRLDQLNEIAMRMEQGSAGLPATQSQRGAAILKALVEEARGVVNGKPTAGAPTAGVAPTPREAERPVGKRELDAMSDLFKAAIAFTETLKDDKKRQLADLVSGLITATTTKVVRERIQDLSVIADALDANNWGLSKANARRGAAVLRDLIKRADETILQRGSRPFNAEDLKIPYRDLLDNMDQLLDGSLKGDAKKEVNAAYQAVLTAKTLDELKRGIDALEAIGRRLQANETELPWMVSDEVINAILPFTDAIQRDLLNENPDERLRDVPDGTTMSKDRGTHTGTLVTDAKGERRVKWKSPARGEIFSRPNVWIVAEEGASAKPKTTKAPAAPKTETPVVTPKEEARVTEPGPTTMTIQTAPDGTKVVRNDGVQGILKTDEDGKRFVQFKNPKGPGTLRQGIGNWDIPGAGGKLAPMGQPLPSVNVPAKPTPIAKDQDERSAVYEEWEVTNAIREQYTDINNQIKKYNDWVKGKKSPAVIEKAYNDIKKRLEAVEIDNQYLADLKKEADAERKNPPSEMDLAMRAMGGQPEPAPKKRKKAAPTATIVPQAPSKEPVGTGEQGVSTSVIDNLADKVEKAEVTYNAEVGDPVLKGNKRGVVIWENNKKRVQWTLPDGTVMKENYDGSDWVLDQENAKPKKKPQTLSKKDKKSLADIKKSLANLKKKGELDLEDKANRAAQVNEAVQKYAPEVDNKDLFKAELLNILQGLMGQPVKKAPATKTKQAPKPTAPEVVEAVEAKPIKKKAAEKPAKEKPAKKEPTKKKAAAEPKEKTTKKKAAEPAKKKAGEPTVTVVLPAFAKTWSVGDAVVRRTNKDLTQVDAAPTVKSDRGTLVSDNKGGLRVKKDNNTYEPISANWVTPKEIESAIDKAAKKAEKAAKKAEAEAKKAKTTLSPEEAAAKEVEDFFAEQAALERKLEIEQEKTRKDAMAKAEKAAKAQAEADAIIEKAYDEQQKRRRIEDAARTLFNAWDASMGLANTPAAKTELAKHYLSFADAAKPHLRKAAAMFGEKYDSNGLTDKDKTQTPPPDAGSGSLLTPEQLIDIRRYRDAFLKDVDIANIMNLPVEVVAAVPRMAPVGQFGQMSHMLYSAANNPSSTLIAELADIYPPKVNITGLEPKDQATIMLDTLARAWGYERSSDMPLQPWIDFLFDYQDRLSTSSLLTIVDGLEHQSGWSKAVRDFAQREDVGQILRELADFGIDLRTEKTLSITRKSLAERLGEAGLPKDRQVNTNRVFALIKQLEDIGASYVRQSKIGGADQRILSRSSILKAAGMAIAGVIPPRFSERRVGAPTPNKVLGEWEPDSVTQVSKFTSKEGDVVDIDPLESAYELYPDGVPESFVPFRAFLKRWIKAYDANDTVKMRAAERAMQRYLGTLGFSKDEAKQFVNFRRDLAAEAQELSRLRNIAADEPGTLLKDVNYTVNGNVLTMTRDLFASVTWAQKVAIGKPIPGRTIAFGVYAPPIAMEGVLDGILYLAGEYRDFGQIEVSDKLFGLAAQIQNLRNDEYGDAVLVYHSPERPHVTEVTRQEEIAHAKDHQARGMENNASMIARFTRLLNASEAWRSAEKHMATTVYADKPTAVIFAEIAAKMWRDDASAQLNLTPEGVQELKRTYTQDLARTGANPEDILNSFKGISPSGDEFIKKRIAEITAERQGAKDNVKGYRPGSDGKADRQPEKGGSFVISSISALRGGRPEKGGVPVGETPEQNIRTVTRPPKGTNERIISKATEPDRAMERVERDGKQYLRTPNNPEYELTKEEIKSLDSVNDADRPFVEDAIYIAKFINDGQYLLESAYDPIPGFPKGMKPPKGRKGPSGRPERIIPYKEPNILQKINSPEMAQAASRSLSWSSAALWEVGGLSKSMLSSFDVSYLGRQMWPLILMFPNSGMRKLTPYAKAQLAAGESIFDDLGWVKGGMIQDVYTGRLLNINAKNIVPRVTEFSREIRAAGFNMRAIDTLMTQLFDVPKSKKVIELGTMPEALKRGFTTWFSSNAWMDLRKTTQRNPDFDELVEMGLEVGDLEKPKLGDIVHNTFVFGTVVRPTIRTRKYERDPRNPKLWRFTGEYTESKGPLMVKVEGPIAKGDLVARKPEQVPGTPTRIYNHKGIVIRDTDGTQKVLYRKDGRYPTFGDVTLNKLGKLVPGNRRAFIDDNVKGWHKQFLLDETWLKHRLGADAYTGTSSREAHPSQLAGLAPFFGKVSLEGKNPLARKAWNAVAPSFEMARKIAFTHVRRSQRQFDTVLAATRVEKAHAWLEEMRVQAALEGRVLSRAEKQAIVDTVNLWTRFMRLGQEGEALMRTGSRFLFSPRLMATGGRLIADPVLARRLPTSIRKTVYKGMGKAIGVFAFLLAFAAWAFDAKIVYDDPTDPGFLRIRVGDYSTDISGGLIQYFTFFARVANAVHEEYFGDPIELAKRRKKGIKGDENLLRTLTGLTQRFLRKKASPLVSAIWSTMEGKTVMGEPTTWDKEFGKLFIPITLGEAVDAWENDSYFGLTMVMLEGLGFGSVHLPSSKYFAAKMREAQADPELAKDPKLRAEVIKQWGDMVQYALREETKRKERDRIEAQHPGFFKGVIQRNFDLVNSNILPIEMWDAAPDQESRESSLQQADDSVRRAMETLNELKQTPEQPQE